MLGLSHLQVLDFATLMMFFSKRVFPCACAVWIRAPHGAIWIQAGCRATCNVTIFLSPEVYAGAKLHNMVRCSQNTVVK